MQRGLMSAVTAILVLALAGSVSAAGSTWRLGPQEQPSYDQPASGRARDILDNRFQGRRPGGDPGSYDSGRYDQPPLGADGEVMDEAARQQWEKEQRIRGFRQQRQEEYGREPDLSELEAEKRREEGPPLESDDPAWQEEQLRRNPLPPETRPRY